MSSVSQRTRHTRRCLCSDRVRYWKTRKGRVISARAARAAVFANAFEISPTVVLVRESEQTPDSEWTGLRRLLPSFQVLIRLFVVTPTGGGRRGGAGQECQEAGFDSQLRCSISVVAEGEFLGESGGGSGPLDQSTILVSSVRFQLLLQVLSVSSCLCLSRWIPSVCGSRSQKWRCCDPRYGVVCSCACCLDLWWIISAMFM